MSNIDQAEITKFDNFAANWWDKNGSCKALHDLNPIRMQFIEQQVILNHKKVLDVGCGGGILSESLAQAGAQVTAIDASAEALQAATTHAKNNDLDITYLKITAEELAITASHEFDVITCLEMLEHVPDPAAVIAACEKLVKPGGHLFFSTINRHWRAYLGAIVAAEYMISLLPIGTHTYEKFIKPSELANWCRANQLSVKKISGLRYNPILRHAKLCNDVNINYIFYCQKQT